MDIGASPGRGRALPGAVLALLLLAGCAAFDSGGQPLAPPAATLVRADDYMIAAAHPLAAEAGRSVLAAGGSAVDAAVAAQMVLTLVEPQSSGIGGGGFLLHYDAKTRKVLAYDGRETAPASARPGMFLDANGAPKAFEDAVVGGLSVGVPGLVRMLALAHADAGVLPWPDLFAPAIALAEQGFPVSPRLHQAIAQDKHLKTFAEPAAYFYERSGEPVAEGALLRNPALAATLRSLAEDGADAFYTGRVAAEIARTVSTAKRNPAAMTRADLAGYRAVRRQPVCLDYRARRVCAASPRCRSWGCCAASTCAPPAPARSPLPTGWPKPAGSPSPTATPTWPIPSSSRFPPPRCSSGTISPAAPS